MNRQRSVARAVALVMVGVGALGSPAPAQDRPEPGIRAETSGVARREGLGSWVLPDRRHGSMATVAQPPGRLGAIGDSLTDEYLEQDYDYARCWTELLVEERGLTFGPTALEAGRPGGTWGEPRRTGYEDNWARAAATTDHALARGQHTGVADGVLNRQVSHVVIYIGTNDFSPWATAGAYDEIYSGLWSQAEIDARIASRVANLETMLGVVQATGASIVVLDIFDLSAMPAVRHSYPDAARREAVATAVGRFGEELRDLVRRRADRVSVFLDSFALGRAVFGTNATPRGTLLVGNVPIDLLGQDVVGGGVPTAGFVHDGVHPNTVLQALWANAIVTALNLGYGTQVEPLSEEEMLAAAGIAYGGSDTLEQEIGPLETFVTVFTPEGCEGCQSFFPAVAVAAGAQAAFFQTDLEINNTGSEEAEVLLHWLPRGQDNSEPVESEPVTFAPGQSRRWRNVLTELFGLQPDSLGALKMVASTDSVIGMSRTYNVPGDDAAGTFGQGMPAVRATEMITGTEPRRVIFLSEDSDSRGNVGCVNGSRESVTISIGIFNAEGTLLATETMGLGPYSNDQVNRIFQDHAPVHGYVDVWADSDDAVYYCYGSLLDNQTSDPTTILPQVPSADVTIIPAAARAAGSEGSFFQTDIDLNNVGSSDITYHMLWLPRGEDNSEPLSSGTFLLAPGAGVRYANVLDGLFGLEPDQTGAVAVEASGVDLLAMSRTYTLPSAKVAGSFGQELPGIPADRLIPAGAKRRIIFMSDNDDVRANVGCVNGVGTAVTVQIELYDSDGVKLETKYMELPPYSNRQLNGVFRDFAPVDGYVDVRTDTPGASICCYGSVLDNVTSDPTTILPQ